MAKTKSKVLQLKITLMDYTPEIWRIIQVPIKYTFWDLHVAIQDAMGWTDTHLHAFEVSDPEWGEPKQIGIPDDHGWDTSILAGWDYKISDYFSKISDSVVYEYDFGDSWHHKIELEAILDAETKKTYPCCISGQRHCPPEDCGGVWGYEEFLSAISNPKHEQHEEMIEWIGGSFDPDEFDPKKVIFDNPKERRKFLL